MILTFSHKTVTLKSRDFSIKQLTLKQEKSDEKEQIYRKSDCLRLEAIRDGSKSGRSMSQNGYQRGNFLQLEKKFGGLGITELRRLRQLEEENSQLKKLVADLSLDKQILQDVLKKKF